MIADVSYSPVHGNNGTYNNENYDTIKWNKCLPFFLTKNVFLEDKTIRLIMWDTAGQERFKALIPSYLKNAHSIILTFDITNDGVGIPAENPNLSDSTVEKVKEVLEAIKNGEIVVNSEV